MNGAYCHGVSFVRLRFVKLCQETDGIENLVDSHGGIVPLSEGRPQDLIARKRLPRLHSYEGI